MYRDELTIEHVAKESIKLTLAFPDLGEGFQEIFQDAVKRNEFTNQRLTDAVNYVIDNCPYPKPRIAQFMSFDKKLTVYTYEQIMPRVTANELSFKTWRPVQLGDKETLVWIHLNDIKKHNLEIYKK